MSEKDQKASVGRIVHFFTNGTCYAAIVTKVRNNNCVDLHVFDNGDRLLGIRDEVCINYSEDKSEYTWHWPERV